MRSRALPYPWIPDPGWRQLADGLPVFLCRSLPDGTILFVNKALAARFKKPAEEIVGTVLYDYLSPEFRTKVKDAIAGLTPEKPECVVEEEDILPDGKRHWSRWINRAEFDEARRMVSCLATGWDITAAKRREKERWRRLEILAEIVSSLTDGVCVVDHCLTIVFANVAQESRHGRQAPLVGKKCYEVFHGRKSPCEVCPVRTTLATGLPAKETVKIGNGAGAVWREIRTFPLADRVTGKMSGVIEVVRDVTEERRIQETLRQRETRLEALWEEAPVAYHLVDTQGTIVAVNRAEETLLGYSREEMVGRSIFDFVAPEQVEEARSRFAAKLAGQEMPPAENRFYVRKNGTRIPVSVRDTFEKDAEGRVVLVRSQMVDLTKERTLAETARKHVAQMRTIMEAMIATISRIAALRDPYTAGHQRRVTQLACAIARSLGLPQEKIECLRVASLLHDIGKFHVPSEILSKPGVLLPVERALVKSHVELGTQLLSSVGVPAEVIAIVSQHHERLDGSGYPEGRRGREIGQEARILALADVVEAMVSHRPYRPAYSVSEVMAHIQSNAGVLFDPAAAEACLRLFEEGFAFG